MDLYELQRLFGVRSLDLELSRMEFVHAATPNPAEQMHESNHASFISERGGALCPQFQGPHLPHFRFSEQISRMEPEPLWESGSLFSIEFKHLFKKQNKTQFFPILGQDR
jgi:hypothetical protein